MHKNAFMLPVSFMGSYTEDEPKFSQQKNTNFYRKLCQV